MKKVTIILIVVILMFSSGCEKVIENIKAEPKTETTTTTTGSVSTVKKTRKELTPQERAELMASLSEDNKRMLQATTQIAMERNGIPDNTSSQLKDWTFAVQTLNATNFWITTTEDARYGRVKSIFTWSGFDSDALTLVYLLVGGVEIADTLQAAQDKAWE